MLSVTAFVLQGQSWVVLTEAVWPTKHKVFAIIKYLQKFAEP